MLNRLGQRVAAYRSNEGRYSSASPPTNQELLKVALMPGDVLLVEGTSMVASAVKYLTHSTWSHAALFVGDQRGRTNSEDRFQFSFVEAEFEAGVRLASIEHFVNHHLRIYKPIELSLADRERVISQALGRIGRTYDMRDILDFARDLVPTPAVPTAWRRKLIAIGSGDPTRAICSSLISGAFQSVRHPKLPDIATIRMELQACLGCVKEVHTREMILRIRHHSLFVPRDFDVSPHFEVIKPSPKEIDYRRLTWVSDGDSRVPGETWTQARPAAPQGSDRPFPIRRAKRARSDVNRRSERDAWRIERAELRLSLLLNRANSAQAAGARITPAPILDVRQTCAGGDCRFSVASVLQVSKADPGSDRFESQNHWHLPTDRPGGAERRRRPRCEQSGRYAVRRRAQRSSQGGADIRHSVAGKRPRRACQRNINALLWIRRSA